MIVLAKGTSIGHADDPSRLLLHVKTEDCDQIKYFSPLEQVSVTTWTAHKVTKTDILLPRIIKLTKRGWLKRVDDPYLTLLP